MKKVYAVILTGGKGVRVASTSSSRLPKQFLEVAGKPVFIHCLETYSKLKEIDKIYIAINPRHEKTYDRILKKYRLKDKVIKVPGGSTRLLSVRNVLKKIDGAGVVVLQNGNSPATPKDVIRKCIHLASKKKAVTAYIPAFYTTFEMDKDRLKTPLERERVGYTCDPQVYDISLLKKVLEYAQKKGIKERPTVELVKKIKRPVFLVRSGMDNMKITTEADLGAVEIILSKKTSARGKRK